MAVAYKHNEMGRGPPPVQRHNVLLALGLLAAAGLGVPCAFAKAKQPADWQQATTVDKRPDATNPVCQQISSNIAKRVANIKGAQAAIAKSAAAPPTSVQSALEDMFGTRQPNAKILDLEGKIKVDRKAAEELNDMMRASQCAPVDIDAAIANHKAPDRAAPEVPKAMPDDLVRTPHRY